MAANGTHARAMGDSVYAYETAHGTRYYFKYRDSSGKQSTKRGFTSATAARKERERLMGRVHSGKVRVSRESLAGWWARWLEQRRPYLERGSWIDYRSHG